MSYTELSNFVTEHIEVLLTCTDIDLVKIQNDFVVYARRNYYYTALLRKYAVWEIYDIV